MRLLMPNVRLIFIMRNPIERAWSHAMHSLLRKAKQGTLENVPPAQIEAKLRSAGVTKSSNYCQILDNWHSVFPAEQLLLVFYDDLQRDPKAFLMRIFNHIGVRTDIDWDVLPFQQRFNVDPRTNIPEYFRRLLEDQYCGEIEALYERFGQPIADWRCGEGQ